MKTAPRNSTDETNSRVATGRVTKLKKESTLTKKIVENIIKDTPSELVEEHGFEDIIKRQREIFNKELCVPPVNQEDKPRKKGRPRKNMTLVNPNTLLAKPAVDLPLHTPTDQAPPKDTNIDYLMVSVAADAAKGLSKCYKCGICLKVLPTKIDMRTHVRTHTGERPHKCTSCDAAFAEKTSLDKHLTTHTVDRPYLQGFQSQLKEGLQQQSKAHPLDVQPTQSHDPTTPPTPNKPATKKAAKKTNKKMALSIKESSYIVTVSTDANGVRVKKFKCPVCSKETTAKADLIKHIRVHTGERPFKCKSCDASFVQVTALRGHETIHTGEKPFACDLCGKKFAIKDRLRLHMRIHTGEKPHNCSICNQTFARRSQVSQHMRSHSTNKDTFKCEECDSSFASYHTLKAHINKHRGIKEFQCPACGKKFLRVEGMYKHIRTVHRGNRPYICAICGKAFKGHLQQHMRLHMGIRPFSCHLCEASFTQNSQLTVHLRIHTGERPYKCQVCGASFAHSSACKIHMRSHTGEKPFQCVICSQPFSQLPHLKKHMKCVHRADKPYMCIVCKEFFQTQEEIDNHKRFSHNVSKTAEEEAQEVVEDSTLARLRNRLAVLLYRISSDDRRTKFGFGQQLVDEVLKLSLQSSGHTPISDSSLTRLDELRQNVFLLLRWTIPKETMEEYHRNNMTVDEVLDMLTS